MVQVEFVYSQNLYTVETKTNEWIEKHPNVIVTDIRYNMITTANGVRYSTMIIYDK